MLTELNPPVIAIALCILGNTIDRTHVAVQNRVVQMKLLKTSVSCAYILLDTSSCPVIMKLTVFLKGK